MNIAIDQDRMILTFDRDYGELIFKHNYKPQQGVVLLRLDEYTPDEPGRLVEKLVEDDTIDFSLALTVLDHNGIRQRKY